MIHLAFISNGLNFVFSQWLSSYSVETYLSIYLFLSYLLGWGRYSASCCSPSGRQAVSLSVQNLQWNAGPCGSSLRMSHAKARRKTPERWTHPKEVGMTQLWCAQMHRASHGYSAFMKVPVRNSFQQILLLEETEEGAVSFIFNQNTQV